MAALDIDKGSTALVIIDLQEGIARNPALRPHPASEVVANAVKLANAFRSEGRPVFLVHVAAAPEVALRPLADEVRPPSPRSANWADLIPELAPGPSDILIAKRQWGAFYGTELDLQLRRRGISTIVLCGIATDYGVESTARFAYEYGYQQVFAEDAMTTWTEEQHRVAVNYVLKRLGRVRSTEEIVRALR